MAAALPIAVQLYTLRDLTKTDFAGTLREVKKIGYAGVELAGYGNLKTAAEVRKACDDAGLKICGAHVGIDGLEKDVNAVLDEQATLGNPNVIVPYMADTRRKDASGWLQVAESMNKIGQAVVGRGLNFGYHNHSFEFQTFDNGKTGMEILFEHTDPRLVKAELDLFWVKHGGQDPVGYLNQLGGRTILVHLKDMAAGADRKFAPVGTGTIDFKPIIDACRKHGVQWGIVEQDSTYDVPPLDAIRTSFENLKKIGAA
jgi:sugar phosphate isomerase/epimerase